MNKILAVIELKKFRVTCTNWLIDQTLPDPVRPKWGETTKDVDYIQNMSLLTNNRFCNVQRNNKLGKAWTLFFENILRSRSSERSKPTWPDFLLKGMKVIAWGINQRPWLINTLLHFSCNDVAAFLGVHRCHWRDVSCPQHSYTTL